MAGRLAVLPHSVAGEMRCVAPGGVARSSKAGMGWQCCDGLSLRALWTEASPTLPLGMGRGRGEPSGPRRADLAAGLFLPLCASLNEKNTIANAKVQVPGIEPETFSVLG